MKAKIVIVALTAILLTGFMNSANAHPCFRPFRPRVRMAIVTPPIFRPPVVVFGAPYRPYPRYRTYGYYNGYYDHGYRHHYHGWR